MTVVFWLAGAYLFGAIPTSYLAGRWGRGIDLREHGSRNLGATNVYRVLGWRYAIPVGLLDAAKGALPVALCGSWATRGGGGGGGGPAWLPVAAGVADRQAQHVLVEDREVEEVSADFVAGAHRPEEAGELDPRDRRQVRGHQAAA